MENKRMEYDFDTVIDRRNTGSLKWDVAEQELPMWVADMDFQTAPEIREALQKRMDHGVFGYSILPDTWYEAYIGWWQRRHQFTIEKEWLIFTTGVVPAISSAVRKFTTPGEKVLVQTPCYNIFFNSILNNGRVPVEHHLIYHENGYEVDWEQLERQLADPQVSLMILCNPHNPVGKIWDRETLARVGTLCAAYHVIVLSDEIHCDLTEPGKDYVPFASVSDTCRNISISCVAPTKTFNIAGLQTAAVFVPNELLRHRMWRALNTDEVAEPNAFAVEAAVAAFTKGEPWLDALRNYLAENKRVVKAFLQERLPKITVQPCEATYLMWLNCAAISPDSVSLCAYIRADSGLYVSEGREFGTNGAAFIRLNTACPRSVLMDGLNRLAESIGHYEQENCKQTLQ